jgi:hypothetical protein
MIITKLQGRLGNQLFQYAVSRSLSLTHNCDFYFDFKSMLPTEPLELIYFQNLKIKEANFNFNLPIIKDDFFYKKLSDNVFLDGYWQSEKYFNEHREVILSDLSIGIDILTYLKNKYPVINDNTVSMHIRRGDYLKNQKKFPIQPMTYYENCYDTLNDSNINILIFSDDISWCRENIKFKNCFFIENEKNITDLYLMSLCKNNIIANSSFSWWGAWLNKHKDKTVFAPKLWFGPKLLLNTEDIVPETWVKI